MKLPSRAACAMAGKAVSAPECAAAPAEPFRGAVPSVPFSEVLAMNRKNVQRAIHDGGVTILVCVAGWAVLAWAIQ